MSCICFGDIVHKIGFTPEFREAGRMTRLMRRLHYVKLMKRLAFVEI